MFELHSCRIGKEKMSSKIILLALLAMLLCSCTGIVASTGGVWIETGSMNVGRAYYTAILLNDGKVLVAGGLWGADSCELYDPSTGTWRFTASMHIGRHWIKQAGVLLHNGKFLISGGSDTSGSGIASCELYDWQTETWSYTGSLPFAPYGHTATLLDSGEVLVVCNNAALYDPETGIWAKIDSPLYTHDVGHIATLLMNGTVVVAGGAHIPSSKLCELFTPAPDIAVTNVVPSKTVVGRGYSMSINVTVENQGDFTETFNITAYANTTVIETIEITLTSQNSTTLTIPWNTTDVPKGNYTISANVTILEGETDTTDNNLTDGWIVVTWLGDLDGDYDIDEDDLWHFCEAFINYYKIHVKDENCDFDCNCIIDEDDLWTMHAAFIDYYK